MWNIPGYGVFIVSNVDVIEVWKVRGRAIVYILCFNHGSPWIASADEKCVSVPTQLKQTCVHYVQTAPQENTPNAEQALHRICILHCKTLNDRAGISWLMGGSDAFAGTLQEVSVATDEAQTAATGRYVGINGIEVSAFFSLIRPRQLWTTARLLFVCSVKPIILIKSGFTQRSQIDPFFKWLMDIAHIRTGQKQGELRGQCGH